MFHHYHQPMKTQQNEGEPTEAEGEERKLAVPLAMLVQIVLAVTSTILTIIVVPWGTWATQRIITLEEFKNQGPRITTKDMENLRMAIKAECFSYYDEKALQVTLKLDAIAKGVDGLRERLIEHEAKTLKSFNDIGGKNGQ